MRLYQKFINMFHAKHSQKTKSSVSHETSILSDAVIGNIGENAASNYLIHRNYRIIHRNFHMGKMGEIDIIAEKRFGYWPFYRRITVFVEVKASLTKLNRNFLPEERVNESKYKKIKKLATIYLCSKGIDLDSPWQIDAIAVEINNGSEYNFVIRHHENIYF